MRVQKIVVKNDRIGIVTTCRFFWIFNVIPRLTQLNPHRPAPESEKFFWTGVCLLLLLRHRIRGAWVVLRGALQHGHRARVVARATIRCRRIVAIELATCRSGRTGGASGWTILGNLRRRELIGGVADG